MSALELVQDGAAPILNKDCDLGCGPLHFLSFHENGAYCDFFPYFWKQLWIRVAIL